METNWPYSCFFWDSQKAFEEVIKTWGNEEKKWVVSEFCQTAINLSEDGKYLCAIVGIEKTNTF